jgi:anti-sigma factor RsiW
MSGAPITEADLHAWLDGQLGAERAQEIEGYLAERPEEAARLATYRRQTRELRALFDPVLDEPLPARLRAAARPAGRFGAAWRAAAAVALLVGGVAAGWLLRGSVEARGLGAPFASSGGAAAGDRNSLARRAAVAYAVYSPDQRRAVEVGAEHEDQLVAWLTKRMGAPMKAPHLQALGYGLEGGRLLPGGQGPVAQFMYRDAGGARLTLYVSNEPAAAGRHGAGPSARVRSAPEVPAAFQFSREGTVNVLTWAEGSFAYAVASDAGRDELARVSTEVYRQLGPAR